MLIQPPSTCVSTKVMNNIACILVLLYTVSASDDVKVIGPHSIQESHTCVGTSTYIPWPLSVISRSGHTSTVIYLTFQRRHSEKKMLIATFSGQQELTIDDSHFKGRLSVSSENSGIFLEQTTMDDAGIYTAQAHVHTGQIWTRSTNLTVLLRPMVLLDRLNISKSEVIEPSSNRNYCVNLTCGTLEYSGYPAVTFVWTASSKILSMKSAQDVFSSSILICSPYLGHVTCSLAGFSSICIYDYVATLHLDLPDPPSNSSTQAKAPGIQDLALTIVMPILAVLVPLTILGVWVLSHILKSYPQFREQRHFRDRGPQIEIDVEENGITEHTHDNGGQSEEETEQMQNKEDIGNNDEEHSHGIMGNNNIQHNHSDTGVADDNAEDDEGKGNEDKPLMNASISTAV